MSGILGLPFKVSYSFDDELREVPDDPEQMSAAVDHLEQLLAGEHLTTDERLRVLGLLGGFCRILGRLDEAEVYLDRALALARESDNKSATIASQIRLAHVYQWKRDFARADPMFEGVIRACERDAAMAPYLDFALQHYGKSRFDQGDYHRAVESFATSLTLREQRDAPDDQLESSWLALVTARQRLEAETGGPEASYDDQPPGESATRISS